jgi:hypothetical protein
LKRADPLHQVPCVTRVLKSHMITFVGCGGTSQCGASVCALVGLPNAVQSSDRGRFLAPGGAPGGPDFLMGRDCMPRSPPSASNTQRAERKFAPADPNVNVICHIATFAKDPGPVVTCHVATFAKNLGINDIDICPNPRDKYAQGNSVLALRELDSGVPATAKLE